MTAICAPCFLILLNSCGPSGMSSDAAGTFYADEITVSSEATGKIEWLDLTEGQQLQAGQAVGQIDTVQLFLQKQQLEESIMSLEGSMPDIDRQTSAMRSRSMPDIDRQTSAMRSRLKQQLREKDRIERLLEDDAATPKDLRRSRASAIPLHPSKVRLPPLATGYCRSRTSWPNAGLHPLWTGRCWPGMPMQESSQSAASRCSGWLIPVQ